MSFKKGHNIRPPEKINNFVIKRNTAYLFLTQGQKAIVDRSDLEEVLKYRWYTHKQGKLYYAKTRIVHPEGKVTWEPMHKFLTNYPLTDHINMNGLDNRRVNLRPTTRSLNEANTTKRGTGLKGVTFCPKINHTNPYMARINPDGKVIHLGYFSTAEEANAAYCVAANHYFGAHARCA